MWKSRYNGSNMISRIGAVILISFSFLALFGLSLSMTTDEHGMMSNCPFMSQTEVVCPMQAGEHIAKWQQAVTGIPQKSVGIAFVMFWVLASWHFTERFILRGNAAITSTLERLKRERGLSALFNIFNHLFSRGILHQKIYETNSV